MITVSAEALQAIVYHITPWQYPSRLASTDMESEGRGAYFMGTLTKFKVSRAAEEQVLYCFSHGGLWHLAREFRKVFFPKILAGSEWVF